MLQGLPHWATWKEKQLLLRACYVWRDLVLAHGLVADAGENYFLGKLQARLPVFRNGPILTGGSYKELFCCFSHMQRQSGALLHVLVARINYVAQIRPVLGWGRGVGWGG